MRALFLLLLLANVAFFAWTRLMGAGGAGADPMPLLRQIEPQKLRVVRPEELARTLSPKVIAAAPPAAPAPVAVKCLEWGAFAPADAARAEQVLQPLQLGERLGQRRIEQTASWWVFIPPSPRPADARQAAQRKAAELKKLGVSDYFIVQEEGPHHWAVSLGVFRSEEAAQARLAALRGQGVRSARIGPRETQVAKVWLQVKAVDPGLETRLQQLVRQIDGSELRECMQ
jgi:cell division septation protein DedD